LVEKDDLLIFCARPKPSAQELFVETLEKWADQYGTETGCYEYDLLGHREVIVCGHDRAMELLKHRPMAVQRKRRLSEVVDSLGAKGVFSAEGEQWKQEHRLVTAALNHKNVQDYLSVLKAMSRRLVQKWSVDCDEGTVSIDDDLASAAADSIAKVSMDRDYDFLNSSGKTTATTTVRENSTARDIKTVTDALQKRIVNPFPFMYWKIPFIGQYLDGKGFAIDRVGSIVNQVVREHEGAQSSDNVDSARKRTFLQKVYEVMKSERSSLSRERMIGNVLTLFIAGSDTTSKALTMALYLLARDREVQETLRREADQIDSLESLDLNGIFTMAPRIKSFLHEVHRLYGVPILGLTTAKDISFCGTTLRKNTDVMILMRYIGELSVDANAPPGPKGSPPGAFDPERWLDKEADHGSLVCPTPKAQVGSYMAFGYGVRACPGRVYSEALSLIVLVMTLQTFEFALAPDCPRDAKFVFDTLIVPEGGVRLSMRKRKEG